MKTVLVTGANGFVGGRVVRHLLGLGYAVRALVRRPESMNEAGVEVAVGDVTDAEAVRSAVAGTDYIVHCAAVPGPDNETSLRVNGGGTENLVEATLAEGCERFVYISTQSVYDKSSSGPVGEERPLMAEGNPYELGKVAGERAVMAGAARGLKVTILRPPAIIGADESSLWGFRIARMLLDKKFPLVGDGSVTFTYVHVDNLARAVVLAMTHDAAVGQAFNIVDGYSTWGEYLEQYRQWLGLESIPTIPLEKAPAVFRWQGYPAGDKLVRVLGYQPTYTYADAMAETRALLEAKGLLKG